MVVPPHDLANVCRSCGVTVEWLSQETGIPVDELLLFAEGKHPLLARDRFAILRRLAEVSPPVPQASTVEDPVKDLQLLLAARALTREVKEEEIDLGD